MADGGLIRFQKEHGDAIADAVLGAARDLPELGELLTGKAPRKLSSVSNRNLLAALAMRENEARRSGQKGMAFGLRATRNLLGTRVSQAAAASLLKRAIQPNDITPVRHNFAVGNNTYQVKGGFGGTSWMFIDLHWSGAVDGTMALTQWKAATVDWVDTTGLASGTVTNNGWDLSLFARDSTLRLSGGRFLPGNVPLFAIFNSTATIDFIVHNANAAVSFGCLTFLLRTSRCKPEGDGNSFIVGQKKWKGLAKKLGFTPEVIDGIEDGDPVALGSLFDADEDDDG